MISLLQNNYQIREARVLVDCEPIKLQLSKTGVYALAIYIYEIVQITRLKLIIKTTDHFQSMCIL